MAYLVVADWDDITKRITAEARAVDLDEAESKKAIMISEGYSNAFHVLTPENSAQKYWTVDPETETVSVDQSQADADALMSNWKYNMMATDEDMPRSTEDIYDALQEDAQARVPQITRDKITAKKTLRGQKP